MPDRRDFLRFAGAAALAGRRGFSAGGSQRGTPAAGPIVIDALGAPGGFDPESKDDTPLSPAELADVQSSGVTAVNVTVGPVGNGPGQFEKAIESIATIERECVNHTNVFLKVLAAKDIVAAHASGRTGLIYGFEDTCMLDGVLSRLSTFYSLGVRIVQPTYNRRNLMGDGCLESADGGLSSLGREFIAEMNRLHILLDLSHGGPRTIAEAIAASSAPAAISHTGCRALVDLPRNVYDRELRALADKGGVAGIYFMPFLRVSGQPHAEDVIRHLIHAVNVCGEDHVGIGTDGGISAVRIDDAYRAFQRKFYETRKAVGIAAPGEAPDVFNLIPEYNSPTRFQLLAIDLANAGWTSGRIEKILGGNFLRLFTQVWSA